MDNNMSLGVLLFLSIPEEFLITVLGLLLFGIGIRQRFGRISLIAVIQAFISFFVRLLPLPFGIHTLIQILLFAIPLQLILRLPYLHSLICILISATIYTVLDATFIPLLLQITDIPLEAVLNSTFLRVLFFIPQALTMLLFVLFLYFTRFKLFNMTNYRLNRSK